MIKVLSVFGTRPEAIKMCPLVLELERNPEIESIVCVTGQHREMLDQVIEIFDIKVDYDLDIMKPKQTLTSITTSVLENMQNLLVKTNPDIVLVHGDTTTSFAVALAAFYQQIPVGHIEAGLRTYDRYSPFPEEMNRNLTGRIATLHFAPTVNNKINLEKENITDHVYITGNTVIDAIKKTVKSNYIYKNETLKNLDLKGKRLILITAHRRENLGQPLENICHAVKRLTHDFPDVIVVYPVHLNPLVQEPVNRILGNSDRIYLIPPIDVQDMHNIMNSTYLVLTDSGGLQEEAPSCGVPVVVLRTETERPEAVVAGTVKVIGINEEDIYSNVSELLNNQIEYDKMAKAVNPYGDGHASERIVNIIIDWYHNR